MPYLVGGISLGVLAVGSTAPGLLTFATDKFQQVLPDYRDRVLRHEDAHFLVRVLHLPGSVETLSDPPMQQAPMCLRYRMMPR